MTHTPGPWYAVDNGHYISIKTADCLYSPSVADVCSSKFLESGDNSKANADLIAAAPDMLFMLRDIYDFLKRSGFDTRLVSSVIAKAEGRS